MGMKECCKHAYQMQNFSRDKNKRQNLVKNVSKLNGITFIKDWVLCMTKLKELDS